MSKCDIGMIGLGVMGSNLAKNMQSKYFSVAVFDKNVDRIESMSKEGFTGCKSLAELKDALSVPRKVFLMVWVPIFSLLVSIPQALAARLRTVYAHSLDIPWSLLF